MARLTRARQSWRGAGQGTAQNAVDELCGKVDGYFVKYRTLAHLGNVIRRLRGFVCD